ncbi:MAG: Ca-activated chloride channel [Blastocatellia bacterium]|jgi:VWFA-related protein/TonB family protein|nr:Ca-activated chloride channel [Blastocatellia bacterium]
MIALLSPLAKVGAQSGRRRETQPAASPRQPAQQRQRRSTSTPPADSAPAPTKQIAPPLNIPLGDPPPALTPTPAAAPASTKSAETQEGDEVDEADVVRINSNLVTVPASVVDTQGRAVTDLKLEDFELRVDGQPKEISELGHSETPVHLVMLFDNSMSLSAAREFEKKAAIRFFRTVMRPIDQAAIYSIWTVPIFVQPFTNDVRTLVHTIENFGKPEEGATALFDTVVKAAEYVRPYAGRKVIVIVSDGADTLSADNDFLSALKHVIMADVQIYAVQTGQHDDNANLYDLSARHRLNEFASQTGGAVYVPRITSDLDAAFTQIAADLSQQYVLSYYPQDAFNDGRFRTISLRVKTRPNMRVRARKGYYDRVGQKQAQGLPFENINIAVTQPDAARPVSISGTGQSLVSASNANNANNERRAPAPTTNNAAPAMRRTSGGNSIGPPGPDDEPERPERSESALARNIPEATPSSSDTDAQPSTSSATQAPTQTPTSTPAPTPASTSSSTPAPAAKPTPAPAASTTQPAAQPAPKRPLSGGALNGKAIVLPKPVYPPSAKSLRTMGTVVVEVLIDESGKVITARAVSGPPALQSSAVQAARQAKFSPTTLSGQPVQVVGTITYSFVLP